MNGSIGRGGGESDKPWLEEPFEFEIKGTSNPDSETNGETNFGTGRLVVYETTDGLEGKEWIAANESSTVPIEMVR
jgi:hypothetical protein